MIGLEFNETVIIDPDWSKSDWNISIIGPQNPYSFDWNFTSYYILQVYFMKNISVWFDYYSPD